MHVCCALILTLLTFQKNGTTRPQRLTSRTACTTGELFAIVCPSIQFPQHRNPPATRQQERLLGTNLILSGNLTVMKRPIRLEECVVVEDGVRGRVL
ncbi:hypothetical protein C8J57DRAFT_1326527, partial [Mycena rebaudengoi]